MPIKQIIKLVKGWQKSIKTETLNERLIRDIEHTIKSYTNRDFNSSSKIKK